MVHRATATPGHEKQEDIYLAELNNDAPNDPPSYTKGHKWTTVANASKYVSEQTIAVINLAEIQINKPFTAKVREFFGCASNTNMDS